MDRIDKHRRSLLMAQVRGKNTGPERRLATLLRAVKLLRPARYQKGLPGRPDFVFKRLHLAVFLDSCFWHGCRYHCRRPRSNVAYWETKIARNKERDRLQTRSLRALGWTVLRVWEHELRDPDRLCVKLLESAGRAGQPRRSR